VHCRANLTFVLRGAPRAVRCVIVRRSGKKTSSAEVGERAGTGVIHPVIVYVLLRRGFNKKLQLFARAA